MLEYTQRALMSKEAMEAVLHKPVAIDSLFVFNKDAAFIETTTGPIFYKDCALSGGKLTVFYRINDECVNISDLLFQADTP